MKGLPVEIVINLAGDKIKQNGLKIDKIKIKSFLNWLFLIPVEKSCLTFYIVFLQLDAAGV